MAKDDNKMKRKPYEKELRRLQVQLCHLQRWVTGTIKALTEKVSPRVFRTVALPAPSDREKTQIFFQRYTSIFLPLEKS
jgi:polyphosphate kinase 2 (PPK2 family)